MVSNPSPKLLSPQPAYQPFLLSLGIKRSFQQVAPQVFLSLARFTTKFGMDWGGSKLAWAPRGGEEIVIYDLQMWESPTPHHPHPTPSFGGGLNGEGEGVRLPECGRGGEKRPPSSVGLDQTQTVF